MPSSDTRWENFMLYCGAAFPAAVLAYMAVVAAYCLAGWVFSLVM